MYNFITYIFYINCTSDGHGKISDKLYDGKDKFRTNKFEIMIDEKYHPEGFILESTSQKVTIATDMDWQYIQQIFSAL